MKFLCACVFLGVVMLPMMTLAETFEEKVAGAGGKKMTGQELAAMFSKPLVYDYEFVRSAGNRGTVSYEPGGTLSIKWRNIAVDNNDRGEDTGTWRIDGDSFCVKFKKIRNGTESCGLWYRTKELSYTTVSLKGEPGAYVEIKP